MPTIDKTVILLRKILWERAKGQLNAMMACCHTTPISKRDRQINFLVQDFMTIIENLIYTDLEIGNGKKKKLDSGRNKKTRRSNKNGKT